MSFDFHINPSRNHHQDHDAFLAALQLRERIVIRFFSKEDRAVLVRTCAPMDFGPSRRAKDKSNRYHLWDYDSDTQRHTLSLPADQIIEMKPLGHNFDPSEFVTWETDWFTSRDWGSYS